jgi:hypothetical protein
MVMVEKEIIPFSGREKRREIRRYHFFVLELYVEKSFSGWLKLILTVCYLGDDVNTHFLFIISAPF